MSGTWQKDKGRSLKRPEDPIRSGIISNEKIRHQEVRVIDENGEQLGIMSSRQALFQARDRGLDLIEVTAESTLPVVKIVDLNKWVYHLKQVKKEQEKKARENTVVTKQIQLRPVTGKHDIEVKQEHARGFLADSNKVRIVVKFKNREINFQKIGFDMIETFISGIGPCKVEKPPEINGKMILAILAPEGKKD